MENKKKRVLICTSGCKPVPDVLGGAVENLVTTLINQNEELGEFDLLVFSIYNQELTKIKLKNSKIILIKNFQKLFFIRAVFSLINRILSCLKTEFRIDYMSIMIPILAKIYSCKDDIVLVENNLRIFFIARRLFSKNKVVFHLHNDFGTIKTDYDKTESRIYRLLKDSDGVLVASKYLQKRLLDINDSAPIYLLQNCIDRALFNTKLVQSQVKSTKDKYNITNEFVILYAGRLSREKGALELILSLKLIKNINFKLLLIGDSWFGTKDERAYRKELDKELVDIEKKIIKIGYVNQKDLNILYSITDIVVVPTQCVEAFGMVALEAITKGKPVIASNSGGLREIIDEKCGRLINLDENYIQNLSNSILELYNNPNKLNDMSIVAVNKSQDFNDTRQYYINFRDIILDIV